MKIVMMTVLIALLPGMAQAGPEESSAPPIAYRAQAVVVSEGKSTQFNVWSDGLRARWVPADGDGEKSGAYYDFEKKLQWAYGPGFPCLQMPLYPDEFTQTEVMLGPESIDDHPTQKFRVTSHFKVNGEALSEVTTEWRATDLGDLVIQRSASHGQGHTLRDIVVDMPDAKAVAFPSGCKYDEMQDMTRFAAQAAGGFRTVRFSDLSCKKLVPLALAFAVPSDFEIREGGPPPSCFAGRRDDLSRLLKVDSEVQFDALRHGVFWLHVSDATYYDPSRKRFVSAQGSDDQWPDAWASTMGASDVKMSRKDVFGIPSLRVTALVGEKTVRMLFLGVGDSPAIRISYQPAGNGTSADAALWQHFLDSIAQEK